MGRKNKRMHTTACICTEEWSTSVGMEKREWFHEDLKLETAFPASATDFPHKIRQPSDPFLQTRVIKIILPALVLAIGITGALFLTQPSAMVLMWLLVS